MRYTLTPQILPRIQELFFSGFAYIAFFMAQIYRAARLLPEGHPYLLPSNMGCFGIRHVIIEAGCNLRFSKEHIDQILIYSLILIGMIVLFMQICTLGFAMFMQGAYAASVPSSFAGYFLVQDAKNDIAFVLLDRVFGVPNIFVDAGGSPTCVVSGSPCFDLGQTTRSLTPDTVIYTDYQRSGTVALNFPWPFHRALHTMFKWYSFGLLLIAVFIFLYFVAAVVAETAQSGTPFGRRFNHVWAPLRIVAAMGLLIPLNSGLNSGQYILLYAAKWGSGFATNGWIFFNDNAVSGKETLLGDTSTLVATPNFPPTNTLLEFFSIVATCKASYDLMYYNRQDRDPPDIKAWVIDPKGNKDPLEFNSNTLNGSGPNNYYISGLLEYTRNSDILIRFGEKDKTKHPTYDGGVTPYCGEILFQIPSVNEEGAPGALFILESWTQFLLTLWRSASEEDEYTTPITDCPATKQYTPVGGGGVDNIGKMGLDLALRYLPICNDANAPIPSGEILAEIQGSAKYFVANAVDAGVDMQQDSPEWQKQLTQLGWGGAAVWYNKVAQLNGSLSGAAYSLPAIKTYPAIMEDIRKQKASSDTDTPGATRHQVYQGKDEPLILSDEEETQISKAMFAAQSLWTDHYSEKKVGGNIYLDAINAVFGTSGLFSIHANADKGIHPLAQLASIGRTIIDSSIRNLGYSAAAGLGGGIINLFGGHLVGQAAMVASGFLSQIAMIGFSIGFVLFYIIPLLPFIYFFFAVGGWIKGIFEAMVGVPLWALAHIRIDGNGLPGDAALGGYYLILEVFLRPIMIVFGFLASITIFSAQVQILHEIWPLVVSNASGFDADTAKSVSTKYETGALHYMRGAVDKFFFTVIYAVIVYMLGLSSFKMIDLVPNYILRWMGASVSTFGDQSGDPAQNLIRNSMVGTNMVTQPLSGAISGAKGAASQGSQAMMGLFGRAQQ